MDKLGGMLIMLAVLSAEMAWYHSCEGDENKVKMFKIFSLVGGIIGVLILVGFALWYYLDVNSAMAYMDVH